jgi:hypothetical protein
MYEPLLLDSVQSSQEALSEGLELPETSPGGRIVTLNNYGVIKLEAVFLPQDFSKKSCCKRKFLKFFQILAISIVIWFFHTRNMNPSDLSRSEVNLTEFLRKYTLRKAGVQNRACTPN